MFSNINEYFSENGGELKADARDEDMKECLHVPMGSYLVGRKYNQSEIIVNLCKCAMHDLSFTSYGVTCVDFKLRISVILVL